MASASLYKHHHRPPSSRHKASHFLSCTQPLTTSQLPPTATPPIYTMKISCLTLAAAGLISVSEGYKLSFYGGAGCRSTPLGVQYPVVDPPNYVCRGIPVNAQSVVINAQDASDSQSSASFFSCRISIRLVLTPGQRSSSVSRKDVGAALS